jgi:hypothetical protein
VDQEVDAGMTQRLGEQAEESGEVAEAEEIYT